LVAIILRGNLDRKVEIGFQAGIVFPFEVLTWLDSQCFDFLIGLVSKAFLNAYKTPFKVF
jgi:hypothetical protein